MSSLIVAIDGPAGAGKSTVARQVAARLGFTLLDSGAIYRALALQAQRQGVEWDDESGLVALAAPLPITFECRGDTNHVMLAGEDVSDLIRTPEISQGASMVSRLVRVREALLAHQRQFARTCDIVAEGRDMGTVVFPGAQVKIFLVADPDERARRRFKELRDKGKEVTLKEVRDAERARDTADISREVSPLKPADDATIVDTTGLSVDQVAETIIERCKEALRERER